MPVPKGADNRGSTVVSNTKTLKMKTQGPQTPYENKDPLQKWKPLFRTCYKEEPLHLHYYLQYLIDIPVAGSQILVNIFF